MESELPDRVVGDCSAPLLHDQLIAPPPASVESRTTPVPTGYSDAEREFAGALALYADRAFIEAARSFLVAARRLELGGGYAEVFRRDRVLAYENAAIAYQQANAVDEGRQELAQRARRDPACAADLERIAHDLHARDCRPAE